MTEGEADEVFGRALQGQGKERPRDPDADAVRQILGLNPGRNSARIYQCSDGVRMDVRLGTTRYQTGPAAREDWAEFLSANSLRRSSAPLPLGPQDWDTLRKTWDNAEIVSVRAETHLAAIFVRGNISPKYRLAVCLFTFTAGRVSDVCRMFLADVRRAFLPQTTGRLARTAIFIHGEKERLPEHALAWGFLPKDSWTLTLLSAERLTTRRVLRRGWGREVLLLPASAISKDRLAAFDARVTGDAAARADWLKAFLTQPGATAKAHACEVAVDGNGDVVGLGLGRALEEDPASAIALGPVYADDATAATALLFGLLSAFPELQHRKTFFHVLQEDVRVAEVLRREFHAKLGLEQRLVPGFRNFPAPRATDLVFVATDPTLSFI